MSTWRDDLAMESLQKERSNPPFDVRKMSIHQHGSEQDLIKKEKFMLEASRDPVFYSGDIYDLTKDQIRERTMQRIQRLAHYITSESVDDFQKRMELMSLVDPALWTRLGVHYGLFLGALRSGATPNQFSYWMEKGVISCQGMYGCFGMTELAHGSNVAGLETTATFDEQTDEFVIHTPNLGATKWWIGGAAQTATHCAVFAQLVIKGKRYGTKTFVVPLRDPQSFQLLPGINIGDIGKKMGRDGIDNGYIQFTNVRIPRAYMLMKHTQVTREGEVREPPLQQLTYGALLQGRTAMVADAANTAKKALTISVRYAAVRRQFKSDAKAELETQILDYPIHQRRLMPLVAQAVAFGFTALELQRLYDETSQALEALEPGDPNLDATIEMLKETHATSAGLKAFCTWATLETIEKSRQACGGHGYSSYNGFANMYSDFVVHCLAVGTPVLAVRGGSLVSIHVEELATGDVLLDEFGRATRIATPVLPVEAPLYEVRGMSDGIQTQSYVVTEGHLLSLRCDDRPWRAHYSRPCDTFNLQWAATSPRGIEWRWTNLKAGDDGNLSEVGIVAPATSFSASSTTAPLLTPPASPGRDCKPLFSRPASASESTESHEATVDKLSGGSITADLVEKVERWLETQPNRVRPGQTVDISARDYANLHLTHPLRTIFGGFRGEVSGDWPEELVGEVGERLSPARADAYTELDPYHLGLWLGNDAPADDALAAFGLDCEKHIPSAYLYGPRKVREMVLAGLLDSDGCSLTPCKDAEGAGEALNQWSFTQTDGRRRLFEDAVVLARSLGLLHGANPSWSTLVDARDGETTKLATMVLGGPGQERVSTHMQSGKRLPALENAPAARRRRRRTELTVRRGGDGHFVSFMVDGPTKRFLLADWTAVHNCTWEGDNSILSLQSGRALIAQYQDAVEGKKLSPGTGYLNNIEKVLVAKCPSDAALDTLEGIDAGWATVAAHAVKKAAEEYQARIKAGRNREQAFEDCSQARFVAASIHTSGYIFRQFRAAVERIDRSDDGVREHLELLAKFYGLWQMEEKAAFFLRSGWLSASQLDVVQAKVTEYCAATRRFAIPLVDSFAISDHVLNSPIGRYDGDIYREYFRMVRRNNPQLKEHPYFDRLIKPFIHRQSIEMENFDEAIGIDDEIEEIKQDREEAEAEAKANKK